MCLILAADAGQRAADTARLRWLLLAGVWVGLGFQAKMLQAWAVLPAFAAGYLLVAPTTVRQRVRHLAAAGAVTLAISASWVLVATLTPPGHRPYIDGSTNNSAFAMVVGYNGTNRFGLAVVPGALGTPTGGTAPDLPPGAAAALPAPVRQLLEQSRSAERTGWGKLFGPELAAQIGWGYPLALVALIVGLVTCRGRLRGGYLMWGVWLVVTGLAFSAGTLAHAAYLSALAAPLAALTGAGTVALWHGYRAGGRRAWLLPAVVGAEAAWTGYLLARYPSFLPWLLPLTLVLAAAGVTALILARRNGSVRPRLAVLGLVTSVAAMSVTPAAWAVATLNPRYTGSVLDAYAGPPNTSDAGGPVPHQPAELTPEQIGLLNYVKAHRDGARYVLATDSWRTASPYVLATGEPVLPMGGFSGAVPAPTLPQFQHLVATGQLHYVLLAGGFDVFSLFGPVPSGPPTATTTIADWVRRTCARTPVSATAPGPDAGRPGMGTEVLYRC
jgi:4-amino-4-deoxy-L-arabinose transferase-like glycosyltransferase